MQPQLTRNILDTLVYFDILDYPLTSFEIWKYLLSWNMEHGTWNNGRIDKFTLGEIIDALESAEIKRHIEEYRGFYFLKGRKELVERRIQNNKNSIEKYKIALKAARWLRFAPFVRMAALTGTLAMKNCEKDSDIDYLVALEKGRIFTGRLFVTAALHLLGRRRYGNKIKNRICLNYFITTGSLEIKRQDLFAANEYTFIYPVFDAAVIPTEVKRSGGIFSNEAVARQQNIHEYPSTALGMTKNSVFCQFHEANFGWIKNFKPNWGIPAVEVSSRQRRVQKLFENLINFLFGDRIEAWLKKKQVARVEGNPLTKKAGAYVEVTDENLIFLPEPQGVRIEEEWQRRLGELKT